MKMWIMFVLALSETYLLIYESYIRVKNNLLLVSNVVYPDLKCLVLCSLSFSFKVSFFLKKKKDICVCRLCSRS